MKAMFGHQHQLVLFSSNTFVVDTQADEMQEKVDRRGKDELQTVRLQYTGNKSIFSG